VARRTHWRGVPVGYIRVEEKDRFHINPYSTDDYGLSVWRDGEGWRTVRDLDEIPDDVAEVLRELGWTYNNEENEARLMSNVSKLLSTGLLVSSTDFAKLTPAKQTEVLASAAGKPIVFVDSFVALRNKRNLVARLVNGEDVTTELEFNELTLTDEEKAVLVALRPILERIRGAAGKYPWIVRTEGQENSCKSQISFTTQYGRNIIRRGGYSMTEKQAKRIWEVASALWCGAKTTPERVTGEYEGYRKAVVFKDTYIEVGCQNINRHEVEYIAEHFGWEPNTEGKDATK
jgi:hypothetical protein